MQKLAADRKSRAVFESLWAGGVGGFRTDSPQRAEHLPRVQRPQIDLLPVRVRLHQFDLSADENVQVCSRISLKKEETAFFNGARDTVLQDKFQVVIGCILKDDH